MCKKNYFYSNFNFYFFTLKGVNLVRKGGEVGDLMFQAQNGNLLLEP